MRSLRKAFSCGAPVPAAVIRRTLPLLDTNAEMHTPYGATEALPVATAEAQEILKETADQTAAGRGICVGRRFENVEWRVIAVVDGPLEQIDETQPLRVGEIGELIVRAPQVSPHYVTLPDANRLAKIVDGDTVWHRMGDVGYFDNLGRFCTAAGKTIAWHSASRRFGRFVVKAFLTLTPTSVGQRWWAWRRPRRTI